MKPNLVAWKIGNLLLKIETAEDIYKQERFKEIFNEYLRTYPRLQEPALRDMLKQMILLYLDVEELRLFISHMNITETGLYVRMHKHFLDVVRGWNLLMTRMGLTFTSQQHIPVEERKIKLPKEIARIHEKMEDLKKEAEEAEKQRKKQDQRINKGGARKVEDGLPIKQEKEAQ